MARVGMSGPGGARLPVTGRVRATSRLAMALVPGPAEVQAWEAAAAARGAAAGREAGLTRRWRPPFPVDVVVTLSVHRRGTGDPAFRIDAAGAVWRTSLTPDGPATLRVAGPAELAGITEPAWPAGPVEPGASPRSGASAAAGGSDGSGGCGGTLMAHAWGPGAAWLLAALPAMLGAGDDPAGFQPAHPMLREMWRRYPGLRIGATGQVLEALIPAVLEQKVVATEAWRAWRRLLHKYGTPAPGPAPPGMRVFPPAAVWARIPSWDWHWAGAEAVRARTVAGAARVAGRLAEITGMTPAAADRRLQSLPGIGPWTSAEIRQRACGDADAVSVGDYHLPGAVGWALARQKVDDAGMLRLLAPYAGHRYRAIRLVELSGMRPPRRGPRLVPRDYSGM